MWPNAHITLLVGPWSAPIITRNPDVDEVLICEFPGFTRRTKASLLAPYAYLWRTAQEIRRSEYDLALIMRFDHWWGAALAFLAHIPRRIGYDIAECRPFLSTALPYEAGHHEVEQNMRLVRATQRYHGRIEQKMDGEARPGRLDVRLRYVLQEEDLAWVKELLREKDVGPGTPLVCIHPGAGTKVKQWAPERFAAVADALAQEYGARIAITGSAMEMSLAWKVASHMRYPAIVLAGRTTIGQLAALMSKSDLVIGSDSGPLHLADDTSVRASRSQALRPVG